LFLIIIITLLSALTVAVFEPAQHKYYANWYSLVFKIISNNSKRVSALLTVHNAAAFDWFEQQAVE